MPKLGLARIIILLALMVGNFQIAASATTATILVTTTQDVIADDGQCSLREAVIAANTDSAFSDCASGSGMDVINFDSSIPLPATFTLTLTGANEDDALTGDLDIHQTLTINGSGSADIILDGDLTDRIFEIHPAAGTNQNPVTLNNLTIRNGDPGSGAHGGGILVDATARLTVNNSLVTSNTATTCPEFCGGGIKLFGVLTINNSTVSNNQGGGVHNDEGILTLNNAQVLDNTAGYGIATRNGGYLFHNGGTVNNNLGGGIYIKNASAPTLNDLTISGNTLGGGLQNESSAAISPSSFTLTDSSVTNNAGTSGAGILNTGGGATGTIRDTSISYNTATFGGGGINNNGILTLSGSTLDHNQARTGGGIDHNGSTLQLTNNTISQNTVSDNGGGVYNRTTMSMLNLTINGNSASGADTGGNIYNEGDSISIKNSIVANPGPGGNCVSTVGAFNSLGHNLESSNSCAFTAAGDIVNTDPLLGPLQNNGGPTPTHALLPGSPAIDHGDDTYCPDRDQRGVLRPVGSSCDIGSVEANGVAPVNAADLNVTKVDALDPVTVSDNITYTVTVDNSGPETAPNVTLTDTLPDGVEFGSAVPDQGSCNLTNGVVTCHLGNLSNSGQLTIEIVVTTTSPSTITNHASVSANSSDPNLLNNSASETTTVDPTEFLIYLPITSRNSN